MYKLLLFFFLVGCSPDKYCEVKNVRDILSCTRSSGGSTYCKVIFQDETFSEEYIDSQTSLVQGQPYKVCWAKEVDKKEK